MLIVYALQNEKPCLMAVSHVAEHEGYVLFIPERADQPLVGISGVSESEYENILSSLYQQGKVNLTEYRARTSWRIK